MAQKNAIRATLVNEKKLRSPVDNKRKCKTHCHARSQSRTATTPRSPDWARGDHGERRPPETTYPEAEWLKTRRCRTLGDDQCTECEISRDGGRVRFFAITNSPLLIYYHYPIALSVVYSAFVTRRDYQFRELGFGLTRCCLVRDAVPPFRMRLLSRVLQLR